MIVLRSLLKYNLKYAKYIKLEDLMKKDRFHHTLAESTTLAAGSQRHMWYFRVGYGEK